MAIARRGHAAGCAHGPGCPHDIGPAAAGIDGLSAMGRLSGLRVPGIDAADVAQGYGPIERRAATPEDLARLTPPATSPAVRPGPAMHRRRPATGAASWRNYRSVMGADAPAPATAPEETVTTPAAPHAIPCGSCLHEPVCGLRVVIPMMGHEVTTELTDGLRMVSASLRVECDHHLATALVTTSTSGRMVPVREPQPIRREHGGESWRDDKAPREERAAAAQRFPLPRDPAERDRLVLEAVRETPGLRAAGARLRVSDTRVSQILRVIRQAGEMPPDVAALLAERGRKAVPA